MTNVYLSVGQIEDENIALSKRITLISYTQYVYSYPSLYFFSRDINFKRQIIFILILVLSFVIISMMTFGQFSIFQSQDFSNLKIEETNTKNNSSFLEDGAESGIMKIGSQIKKQQFVLSRPNAECKMVEEVLYKKKSVRKWRRQFQQHRIQFIDQNKQFQGLHLAKHNMVLDPLSPVQFQTAKEDFDAEWQRLEDKFHLSNITGEMMMCVVVPSFNNEANFRIEYNLNSIFAQNYTNFKVVVINDASIDKSGEVYRSYFKFYDIDPQRYVYIENTEKKNSLQNIYMATTNHCSKNSIVLTVDGDDELIGRNVLKLLNWGYQTKKAGVIYSNFYFYYQPIEVNVGFTQQYSEVQKYFSLYRNVRMKFSHLKSFRAQLFLKINIEDLKDQYGHFYKIVCDQAFFFTVMQLSCGRVYRIQDEFQYLYNRGTGLNAYDRGDKFGQQMQKRIRGSKKYECLKNFEERMQSLE